MKCVFSVVLSSAYWRVAEEVPTGCGGSADGSRREYRRVAEEGSDNLNGRLRETRRQATRATEGGSTFPVQKSQHIQCKGQHFPA